MLGPIIKILKAGPIAANNANTKPAAENSPKHVPSNCHSLSVMCKCYPHTSDILRYVKSPDLTIKTEMFKVRRTNP
jgi:hypothetical protein